VNLKLKGTNFGGNYVIRVQFLNLDDELSDYVEETLALTTAYSVETLTFSSPVSAKIADNKLYIRITVVSGPDPKNVAIFKGGTPQLPYVVVAGTWVTEDTDAVNNIDLASDGSNLLACSADGVWLSDDLGVSWTQYKPDSADDTSWTAGVISTSGTYVVVFDSGGNCYRSANSGTAWSAIDPADGDSFTPVDIDSSDNGQYVLVVGTNTTDSSRTAFRSEDYGATWAAINPTITAGNYNWTQCQISNTGRLIGLSRSGAIYMSWNEGVLWEGQSLPTSGSTWDGFAISGDGKVGIIANTAADNEWFQNSGWYERPIFGETAITETARSILDDTTTAGVATTIGLGTGDSPAFTGLSLSGLTASRLIATDASKNLTSLASPLIVGEGGTGAATLTDGGIVLGSGTGAVTVLAQATDGQLPIGSTGLDPVLATITGTAGEIVVTNAAGSITLSLGSAIGDIAALTPTDGNFIVGDGTNWVAESGATARTSIGLGTGDSPQFTGGTLLNSGAQATLNLESYRDVIAGGSACAVISKSARGTSASPDPMLDTNLINAFYGQSYHSGGDFATVAFWGMVCLEDHTDTNRGTGFEWWATPVGSVDMTRYMTYSPNDGLDVLAGGISVVGASSLGDGGTTNYAGIAANGHIVLNGTGKVWKDENAKALVFTGPAATRPGTVFHLDSAGNSTSVACLGFAVDDSASGVIEIPHDYAEGTDITLHIHWQGIADPGGTKYVKWQLTYTRTRADVVTPVATVIVVETSIATQYMNKLSSFPAITGTDYKIGDQFGFQLKRIASVGAAYAGEALIDTLGIHYQANTIGSSAMLTK